MKHIILGLSLSVLLVACGADEKAAPEATKAPEKTAEATPSKATEATDKQALIAEAKMAIKALGGTLKGELQLAMKNGGPVNALSVCNEKAPAIAKAVAADKQLQVSRVSLKNRNPVMGQANEWQEGVLNEFETRKAGGEKPATLAYADIVEAKDGKKEFRFMKAIPTGSLCLTCHGSNIKPEVSEKIAALYPEDKATGYKEGDLRGAFVVVKQLAD